MSDSCKIYSLAYYDVNFCPAHVKTFSTMMQYILPMPRYLQYIISCTTVLANLLLPKLYQFLHRHYPYLYNKNNTMFRIYVDFQPTMNKLY
jgi:hypothetical protein